MQYFPDQQRNQFKGMTQRNIGDSFSKQMQTNKILKARSSVAFWENTNWNLHVVTEFQFPCVVSYSETE